MPQKSPVYAVTRIRVHEKDMVKPERMARMAEASPAMRSGFTISFSCTLMRVTA